MSINTKYEISVNIALYNNENYIKECILSLLNQTFENFEIIVVDDGSTDKSLSIVKMIKDNRIKVFENNKNRGIVYTRNRAIKESSGRYIAILDSDDMSYPHRLEKQYNYLQIHQNISLIGSWYDIIDEHSNRSNIITKSESRQKLIKPLLLFKNTFGQQTIMARSDVFKKYIYSDQYFVAEDYDLWVRISKEYEINTIPEVLVSYRVHQESITSKNNKDMVIMTKKVMRDQLLNLGINANDEDINLHYSLSYGDKSLYVTDIKKICSWLLKIEQHNKEKNVYRDRDLKLVLAERWFHACVKLKDISRFSKLYYYLFYINNNDYWLVSKANVLLKFVNFD